jgi:hypothetical protein
MSLSMCSGVARTLQKRLGLSGHVGLYAYASLGESPHNTPLDDLSLETEFGLRLKQTVTRLSPCSH